MDKTTANQFLKSCSTMPGVYQMYDKDDKLLYVGKAKNLKNRLSSYFRENNLSIKTAALVEKIDHIHTLITKNEIEALLLEQNLIKENRPPFNILLRDDKSYPFIVFSDDKYPSIAFRRKKNSGKNSGNWFGPYTSSHAVKQSINLIQKTFKIRDCSAAAFANRSRPCLQHQIQRCSAPCVAKISQEDYKQNVLNAKAFLAGKSQSILDSLADNMEKAAQNLEFEKASEYRDQIIAITKMQSTQDVDVQKGDADIFAVVEKNAIFSLAILCFREGRLIRTRLFIVKNKLELNAKAVLQSAIEAFYFQSEDANPDIAQQIICNIDLDDTQELTQALQQQFNKNIKISYKVRSQKNSWLEMAINNANENLLKNYNQSLNNKERIDDLSKFLNREIKSLECFDISHTQGNQTKASCVVFNEEGPNKTAYRQFDIEGITGGDDYAAMQQVLKRRYSRLKNSDATMPDLILIDGGKGQLNAARKILDEIGVQDICLLGVAKGTSRKLGLETLFLENSEQGIILPATSPALHLIQHIRDESHRFAITAHRKKRSKAGYASILDDIPGIGAKKRQSLLRHFGSAKNIAEADVPSLCKVDGISEKLAEEIYLALKK